MALAVVPRRDHARGLRTRRWERLHRVLGRRRVIDAECGVSGLGWRQLVWMFTTFHLGHYMPLTWLTFGMDYVVWGMNPVGYHLTTLVLHVATTLVVYAVAVRLIAVARPAGDVVARRIGGALAALLFALHPLRVESVAWATERRDVLCGLLYMLASSRICAHAMAHRVRVCGGARRTGRPGSGRPRVAFEVDGGEPARRAARSGRISSAAARRRPGRLVRAGSAARVRGEGPVHRPERGGERGGADGIGPRQGHEADRRGWPRRSSSHFHLLARLLLVEDGAAGPSLADVRATRADSSVELAVRGGRGAGRGR